MKKIFQFLALSLLIAQSSATFAQEDKNLFNHLNVGLTVGTDGLPGIDVAAPIGNYVQVRAGYSFVPKFKFKANINYTRNGGALQGSYKDKIAIKLNKGDFKLLFDAFPFKKSSFHVTAGAYIGSSDFAKINNDGPISGVAPNEWGTAKIQISNNPAHMFSTDENGNIKGRVRVNSFKPYIGVGFGRAVSADKKVTVNFDLGIQLWGKPKLEIWSYDIAGFDNKWVELKKADFDVVTDGAGNIIKKKDKDGYNVCNICGKIFAYPVLSVRVGFNAF